jgi:hypothetical protein
MNHKNSRVNCPELSSLRFSHEFPVIIHGEDTHKGYHKIHRGQEWIEIGPDCFFIDALLVLHPGASYGTYHPFPFLRYTGFPLEKRSDP